MTKEKWLEISGLKVSRGGRVVLRDLHVSLGGRVIGLVGANGAGKTTLIGTLLGVLRPDEGSVRVLDLSLPSAAMKLRRRAGVMAEQAGIFPGGSGVDAVSFAGQLSGLSRREALRSAHRALDALGVAEERYRPADGYSTGMRQKTKLAMALVHQPEVLILDEPTVGLDPETRASFLDLIEELASEVKVLLSTHILQDAERVCDQLLLLDQGQVRYSGLVSALLSGRDPHYRARCGEITEVFFSALKGEGLEPQRHDGDLHFIASDQEALARFWAAAAQHEISVKRLEMAHRGLEDAVIERMGEAGR